MSTKDLKRNLGFLDLFGMSLGQIIGAGIMAFTGIAIAYTGKSANIAFLLASLFCILSQIPLILYGSVLRLRGGTYTIVSTFISPMFSGFYIIAQILQNCSIALYALSLAQYIATFMPHANIQFLAFIIVTAFFILSYFGVSGAAKVQNIFLILLLIALAIFIFYGIQRVDFANYTKEPDFMSAGVLGIFQAAALLIVAASGAERIVELSAEAKKPKRDIPLAMLISTLSVALLYAVVATIDAGILPLEKVANQPLSVVAKVFLSGPLFVFFVVGGGILALATSLNSVINTMCKPSLQACDDGWFPKKLGKLSKHKTPIYLLGFFYIVGLLPIIFNINIAVIASVVAIISLITRLLMSIALLKLPKRFPKEWKNSALYVKKPYLYLLSALSCLACAATIILLIMRAPFFQIVIMGIIIGLGLIFMFIRYPKVKDSIQNSYEEE